MKRIFKSGKRRWIALLLTVVTVMSVFVPFTAYAASDSLLDMATAEVSWNYTLKDEEGNTFSAGYGISAKDNVFGQRVSDGFRSMHDYSAKRIGISDDKDEWVYGKDYIYCFCIEHGVPLPNSHEYIGSVEPTHGNKYEMLSPEQKDLLSLALLYGYPNMEGIDTPYKANASYAATQLVVWQITLGFRTSPTELDDKSHPIEGYTGTMTEQYTSNKYLKYYYDLILEKMEKHEVRPSFTSSSSYGAPTYSMEYKDGKYTVTLTDTNRVLSEYSLTSSGGVSVSISGNTMTLSSSTPINDAVSVKLNRKLHSTTMTTNFLIWSVPGHEDENQDMVSGVPERNDPCPAFLKVQTTSGGMKIVKTSEDGKVDGVKFRVEGNGINQTVTTKNGGQILVDNLRPGVYTVTEQTENRYEPQESRQVTVVSGQTATVTFNNKLKRGDLTVRKVAEDGLDEGVKFHLFGTSLSGLAVDEYAIVGSDGKAYFRDVLVGTSYTLEEVDTPDRYVVPDDQTVEIEWNKVTNKTFDNNLKRGDLTVTKTAEDGLTEGMRFHLYGTSYSGSKVDEYATVGRDGKAYFKDVLIGTGYTLEEVGTPDRYVIPDKQTADIEWNKVTNKDFENNLKRGNLTVTKTAEDGLTEGMRFHLYGTSYSGSKVDEYATVGKDGKAYFKDVLIGTGYTLEEVGTPDRYVVPDDQTADIEWNKVTNKDFENNLKRGDLTVTKTAEDGLQEGLRFHLYGKSYSGLTVDEYATVGADGKAYFTDILIGKDYLLEEVGSPDRYVIPDVQSAVVEWNTVTQKSVDNPLKKWNLTVTKRDSETGAPQGDGSLA